MSYEVETCPGAAQEDSDAAATPLRADRTSSCGNHRLSSAGWLFSYRGRFRRNEFRYCVISCRCRLSKHRISSPASLGRSFSSSRTAWHTACVRHGSSRSFCLLVERFFRSRRVWITRRRLFVSRRRHCSSEDGANFTARAARSQGGFRLPAILAVVVAIGASALIGLAVYRGVPYDNSLWWEFSYHQDASRFLRATLGAAIIAVGHCGLSASAQSGADQRRSFRRRTCRTPTR